VWLVLLASLPVDRNILGLREVVLWPSEREEYGEVKTEAQYALGFSGLLSPRGFFGGGMGDRCCGKVRQREDFNGLCCQILCDLRRR
jgi:hypothetical protein